MVGSLTFKKCVPQRTLTVRVRTWRSLFFALAAGEDAHEERRRLKDQAHDLVKLHMPTPFRKRREKSDSLPT